MTEPKTKNMTVRMPVDLLERLRRIAEANDRSLNYVAVKAMEAGAPSLER